MRKYCVYTESKTGQELYICCLLYITVLKVELAHYRLGQTLSFSSRLKLPVFKTMGTRRW